MEYMVYNLRYDERQGGLEVDLSLLYRPHLQEDEDLSIPPDEAIIPNPMLEHSDILEIVLNIRNKKLRKSILLKKDINYEFAANVLFKDIRYDTEFEDSEVVVLRVEAAMQLPVRLFKVEMVMIYIFIFRYQFLL